MKKLFSVMLHLFLMVFSVKYRKKMTSQELLAKLQLEVDAYEYHSMYQGVEVLDDLTANDTKEVRDILRRLQILGEEYFEEGIIALTKSRSIVLLALVASLSRTHAGLAAERLMSFARRNAYARSRAGATSAKRELLLARKWYEYSGHMSHATEVEIERGLARVSWIDRVA